MVVIVQYTGSEHLILILMEDLYIFAVLWIERGLHFVGEALFRRNFPTTLMYLIILHLPDRLVCVHAQNDGLVRRYFYSAARESLVSDILAREGNTA